MRADSGIKAGEVIVSGGWWGSMQNDLKDAVEGCNHITGLINAHQYEGKYSAEELLDHIERDIREIRKLVEASITPF